MPYISTKRSRNLGTANCSMSPTARNENSTHKVEKISRFFTTLPKNTKNAPQEAAVSDNSSDSPYKNCLSEVKCAKLSDSVGDLDDFRTPTAIKKVSKLGQVKPPKNAKKRKKGASNKASMRKFIEDNFRSSDVNPDHLQMALALSESSYEAENPAGGPNSQEKTDSFKKAFEKFGFGYGKSKVEVENKRDLYQIVTSSNKKNNTKSRYRFVTPILKLRTPEEREALISSKVSLILAQNSRGCASIQNEPIKLFCQLLQQYHCSKIFKLNQMELEQLNQKGCFYSKGLEVEVSETPCGYLLKDWGRIAGRDVSPIREPSSTSNVPKKRQQKTGAFPLQEASSTPFPPKNMVSSPVIQQETSPPRKNPKYIYDGSMSPDLFGSDDEYSAPEQFKSNCVKSPWKLNTLEDREEVEYCSLTQSNEKVSNGKYRGSSSMQNVNFEPPECYDLTQSDEEDEYLKFCNPEKDVKEAELKKIMKKECSNLTKSKDQNENLDVDFPESVEVNTKKTEISGTFWNDAEYRSSEPKEENQLLERRCRSSELSDPFVEDCAPSSPYHEDEEIGSHSLTQSSDHHEDLILSDLKTDRKEAYRSFHAKTSVNIEEITGQMIDTETPQYNEKINKDESSEQEKENWPPEPFMEEWIPPSPFRADEEMRNYNSTQLCHLENNKKSSGCEYHSPEHESHTPLREYQSLEGKYQSPEPFADDWVQPPPFQANEEMECYDLTQSDDDHEDLGLFNSEKSSQIDGSAFSESESFQVKPSTSFGETKTGAYSPQNNENQSPERVYQYSHRYQSPEPFVEDWAQFVPTEETKTDPEPPKKFERISSSEDDSKLSQESIYISDDELNYSSVYATPHRKEKSEGNLEGKENNFASLGDSFNDILGQTKIVKALEATQTPNKANTTLNGNFLIKTKNITPMANYDEMDTPKIVKELDKFGLKPLKRQRGVKLLKYIYESTHPLVNDDEGEERVAKKRRTGSLHFEGVVGDIEEDEWIFERTQSKRIASCRVPLHIVWHNFVVSNPKVRENILLYEPLQLEVLHSMLKEQGFKFNIQDLLTFLDKKCITIRTTQGQRYGKKLRT